MLSRLQHKYKALMEYIVIILMIVLSLLVVVAVVYRKSGMSLSWYDEVASVLLAWLTYYASALAALTRGHIGFNGLLNAMKPSLRIPVLLIGESLILAFFILLAWVGYQVLTILGGDSLTSLTWVPTRLTQSVIPIGAVLFIIGQLLSFPDIWRQAKTEKGITGHEDVEIPEETSKNSKEVLQP
ncbi:MAG: TRAP transporter small permease subunit [Desulfohalobiaceae bacterium]|nr:TRAP transporter small permease subunit [Desulfohalobiaceae bacterium]